MPKVVQSFPLQQQKGRKAISNQLNGWQFPIKNIIDVAGVAPVVSSIGQSEFTQGSNISGVVITGTGFTGATSISLGAGITINSFDVTDDNNINIVDADVDQNAATGNRDVSVSTPFGTGTLLNGCQVIFGFGNALKFDGVNDYVSFTPVTANEMTISLWAKASAADGTFGYYFSSDTTGTDREGLRITETAGGSFGQISYFDGAAITNLHLLSSPLDWNHLVLIRNTTTKALQLYVNGVSVYSSSIAAISTNNIFILGTLNGTANYLNGTLDEVSIWNTALSGTDITNLYNSGNGNLATNYSSANLLAYWRMNESGTDTTAVDEQGTYDGTLNNFSGTYWVPH
jgi:hypothetical protein